MGNKIIVNIFSDFTQSQMQMKIYHLYLWQQQIKKQTDNKIRLFLNPLLPSSHHILKYKQHQSAFPPVSCDNYLAQPIIIAIHWFQLPSSWYNHAPMKRIIFMITILLILTGCQPETAVLPTAAVVAQLPPTEEPALPPAKPAPATAAVPHTPTPQPTDAPTETTVPPTFTPIPTETALPTFTPMPLRTILPILTTIITTTLRCENRQPQDNLLSIITKTYGISRDYEPTDLVALSDYFPHEVTLGYPTDVRAVIIEPLVNMIGDMRAAGLQPQILSGYRSYIAQSLAFDKWLKEYPDRAVILSAPPGHSEHQLGTTVDFGSPELPGIVGEPNIQFHTYFYMTSESIWLAENAHRYGFTLSFPREAFELTGFAYEPWHYRYVGIEMASQLKEMGITLTEYLLANEPPPCIPYQS